MMTFRHLTMMSTEEEEKPPMLFMESQRQFLQEMHFLNYAYETAFRAFDLLDESDMEEWKRVAKALSILGKKPELTACLADKA